MKPKRPGSLIGKPTIPQLRAWLNVLKRYDAALQRWDDRLTVKDVSLQIWEESLMAIEDDCGEACDCQTADDHSCQVDDCDDTCDCDTRHPNPRQKVEVAPPQADIAWLEGLYKLTDRRRKKKK